MVRFIDVPIGAIFEIENGTKFKKVRQTTSDEYYNQMHTNCINLANNHEVCIGVLTKCWIVEEEE